MEQLTNLFQAHKTVKFELRPIGKTEDLIDSDGFLMSDDKEKAMAYQVVKCLIEYYYQNEVIAPLLEKIKDDKEWNSLLVAYGNAADSNERKAISKKLAGVIDKSKPTKPTAKALYTPLQDYLETLKHGDVQLTLKDLQYDEIFIKGITLREVWGKELKDFVQDAISKFKDFTLYLDPLAINMDQVFSGKKNGLAYRIVYQNLYTFFKNKKTLDDLRIVIEEFGNEREYLVTDFSECLLQSGIDEYNMYIGQLVKKLKEYSDSHPKSPMWHKRFKQLNKQILSPRIAPSWLPAAFMNDSMMVVAVQAFLNSVNPLLPALSEIINQIDTYDGHIYIYRKSLRSIAAQMTGDYTSLDDAFEIPGGNNKSESLSLQWMLPDFKEDFFLFLKSNLSATLLSIQNTSSEAEKYLSLKRAEDNDYRKDNQASISIKRLVDSYKQLYSLLRPLNGTGDEEDQDEDFYGDFMPIIEMLRPIIKLFDSVRNWLTKSAFSNDSYPVYLGLATILKNWTKKAVYIKKEGKYYFCIAGIKHGEGKGATKEIRQILKQLFASSSQKDATIYLANKQTPDRIAANLPRIFICSKKGEVNSFVKTEHPELKAEWEQLKDDRYKSPDMKNEAICYFQKCLQLHNDYRMFNFHFQPASEYDDYNSFVESLKNEELFLFEEKAICWDELLQLVEEGKIYLFQLYNKDYANNRPVNSAPNLHTLYWETVFSQQNRLTYDFKLEEPKLYFREIADVVQRTGDYHSVPLRYQKPKLHLHIPILMNANSQDVKDINRLVIEQVQAGAFSHIIGIDRGERNLLYYSILDMDGNIVGQDSLNVINGIDYHEKLMEKENDLDDERRNWKVRSGIRKLKEGYISQAIHQLTTLIVKHNAIVVLEDLDDSFKHGRQKIDMQIYQLFEKMLIEKLSFMVDKHVTDENRIGSPLHALQLTNPDIDLPKTGIRQNGILFFVPPEYTSAIDPVTGFCNLFDKERVKDIRRLLTSFRRISYNAEKDWFEFEWDYQDVVQYTRLKQCANPQPWVACTYGERVEWTGSKRYRNQKCECIALTAKFKALFEKYKIEYLTGANLKDVLYSINKKDDIKELKRLFFLTLSLRNKPDKDTDYILSPVQDANIEFFDSRKVDKEVMPKLPENGDANGAYNIARKGLLSLKKLKNGVSEQMSLEEWVQSFKL